MKIFEIFRSKQRQTYLPVMKKRLRFSELFRDWPKCKAATTGNNGIKKRFKGENLDFKMSLEQSYSRQ